MSPRLVHVVIDAIDPAWQARGWEIAPSEPDEVDVWPAGCSYPDPVALPLVFVRVPEPKTVKNRVHLDLATTSAEQQESEVGRIIGLGAAMIDIGQGDVPWTVLADPERSEFCVLTPAEDGP